VVPCGGDDDQLVKVLRRALIQVDVPATDHELVAVQACSALADGAFDGDLAVARVVEECGHRSPLAERPNATVSKTVAGQPVGGSDPSPAAYSLGIDAVADTPGYRLAELMEQLVNRGTIAPVAKDPDTAYRKHS
jgi:hypothetical protein